MSEESLEEKTEEASPRKREQMREDGKVAQSRELVSAILMLAAAGALYYAAGWSFRGIGNLFESSFMELSKAGIREWTPQTIIGMASFSFKAFAWILAPVAGTAMVAGVLGSVLQFGVLWTTKPLELDLNKINPGNGIARIFGKEGLFELFKATAKMTIVSVILYLVFIRWLGQAGFLWGADVQIVLKAIGHEVMLVVFTIAGAMTVMSAGDFAFQKFQFEEQIKMTKQEVREERKQVEGNPQIKARIRSIQRRFATSRMLDAVKTADVVITNPTHFAVALVYDRENMLAPKIVAKGVDHMAQKIKQVARENGVPCVENVPLARALYKALKIGQFISKDLYNAVAEVLAYVYRLRGRNL